MPGSAAAFGDDVAGQIFFEREARREGLVFARTAHGAAVLYRLAVGVPGTLDEREIVARVSGGSATAWIDGPVCLRHRNRDRSLCMWFEGDGADASYDVGEGLLELTALVREHAFCEAECRAGRGWPKDEAGGRHRRPPGCPTCKGRGR